MIERVGNLPEEATISSTPKNLEERNDLKQAKYPFKVSAKKRLTSQNICQEV